MKFQTEVYDMKENSMRVADQNNPSLPMLLKSPEENKNKKLMSSRRDLLRRFQRHFIPLRKMRICKPFFLLC